MKLAGLKDKFPYEDELTKKIGALGVRAVYATLGGIAHGVLGAAVYLHYNFGIRAAFKAIKEELANRKKANV